jgi:hypothetical protein
MIIGRVGKDEKKIKFQLDVKCTRCGKTVPGGMQASENYFGSESFKLEVDNFKKKYLCGICRDKKMVAERKSQNP